MVLQTRTLLLTLVLMLGAAGCGDDAVPAAATVCTGLKTTPATDTDVLLAISTHVPVALNTYCTSKVTFLTEAGLVHLTYIAYGSAPATPTPTVANTVCALDYNQNLSLLFDAVWANNEPPLTISQECPAIALNATGDTANQCTAPPVSGRSQPIMGQANFRTFLEQQPIPRQFGVCGRVLPHVFP